MAKETNIPPFGKEGLKLFQQLNPFKQYKFPEVETDTLLSNYKQNVELINRTQNIATETTQSVIDLHKQSFKKVFDQWNEEIMNSISNKPFEEKMTHQAETAKTLVDEMINHMRDVNVVIAESNKNIIDSIQNHLQEGLNESATLVKKGKEQR